MQCISCTRASSSTKYSLMNFGNNSFMNHFRIHALNVHFGFVQLVLHNFLQIKYSNWQTFKMSYLKFCSQLGQVTFSQSKPSSTIYNTSLKKFANILLWSDIENQKARKSYCYTTLWLLHSFSVRFFIVDRDIVNHKPDATRL